MVKKRGNRKPTWHWKLNGSTQVIAALRRFSCLLRCPKKRARAEHIIEWYEKVSPRNGYYTLELEERKRIFEDRFFKL